MFADQEVDLAQRLDDYEGLEPPLGRQLERHPIADAEQGVGRPRRPQHEPQRSTRATSNFTRSQSASCLRVVRSGGRSGGSAMSALPAGTGGTGGRGSRTPRLGKPMGSAPGGAGGGYPAGGREPRVSGRGRERRVSGRGREPRVSYPNGGRRSAVGGRIGRRARLDRPTSSVRSSGRSSGRSIPSQLPWTIHKSATRWIVAALRRNRSLRTPRSETTPGGWVRPRTLSG